MLLVLDLELEPDGACRPAGRHGIDLNGRITEPNPRIHATSRLRVDRDRHPPEVELRRGQCLQRALGRDGLENSSVGESIEMLALASVAAHRAPSAVNRTGPRKRL